MSGRMYELIALNLSRIFFIDYKFSFHIWTWFMDILRETLFWWPKLSPFWTRGVNWAFENFNEKYSKRPWKSIQYFMQKGSSRGLLSWPAGIHVVISFLLLKLKYYKKKLIKNYIFRYRPELFYLRLCYSIS